MFAIIPHKDTVEKKKTEITTVNTVAETDTVRMPIKKEINRGITFPVLTKTSVAILFFIGPERSIIPIVAIKESNNDEEQAVDGEIIRIKERIRPRKFKESVLLLNTLPSNAHDAINTALIAETENPVRPRSNIKTGTVKIKRVRLLFMLRKVRT